MGMFDNKRGSSPKPKAAPKAASKPAPKAAQPKAAQPKAAKSNGTGKSYSAAVCGDGITVAHFEELSHAQWQQQKGNEKKTLQDWRDAVVDALGDAKKGDSTLKYKGVDSISADQASRFHKVADAFTNAKTQQSNYTSSAAMESLLGGKVKGLHQFGNVDSAGKWVNYYPTYRMPMWMYLKKKGLAYEGFWQPETTASFVDAKGKTVYVDPTEISYLVSNAGPVGSFVKLTAPNGKSTYARILERGTSEAEVSLKAWWNLGYANATPNQAPTSKLVVETFDGSGALPKKGTRTVSEYGLTDDEIQRAGKLIDDKKVKSITSRKDLEAAERKNAPPQQAPATSAGGSRLEKGFPTIGLGMAMRRVGYASPDCLHDGGGYVCEGSASVFVGKFPFARIGDATSDGLEVITGDDGVYVGGSPTSATLQ